MSIAGLYGLTTKSFAPKARALTSASFSVFPVATMTEDEDLSGFYIIFKDGGKAYVYDDGYGDLVNWLKSDDSIMIGDLHL